MKTLEIVSVQSESLLVSRDMRKLYEQFEAGALKREDADTLANIAGKNLKALSLILADKIFSRELRVVSGSEPPKLDKKTEE